MSTSNREHVNLLVCEIVRIQLKLQLSLNTVFLRLFKVELRLILRVTVH